MNTFLHRRLYSPHAPARAVGGVFSPRILKDRFHGHLERWAYGCLNFFVAHPNFIRQGNKNGSIPRGYELKHAGYGLVSSGLESFYKAVVTWLSVPTMNAQQVKAAETTMMREGMMTTAAATIMAEATMMVGAVTIAATPAKVEVAVTQTMMTTPQPKAPVRATRSLLVIWLTNMSLITRDHGDVINFLLYLPSGDLGGLHMRPSTKDMAV